MYSKKYKNSWIKWIFEKRVFAFEFFSGTSGFWISVKFGHFTSGQVPIIGQKIGINGSRNGWDLDGGYPDKEVSASK